MKDEVKIAVLIGRLLELFGRGGDPSSDDHRTALRALVELAARRSATVRLDRGSLRVEGIVVPDDTPFVPTVLKRFDAHGIAAMQIANGTSAVDFVNALRLLAMEPTGSLEQELRAARVTSLSFVSTALEASTRARRNIRVTEALTGVDVDPEGRVEGVEMGLMPSDAGAAYDELVRHQRASRSTIAGAVHGPAQQLTGQALRSHLESMQVAIMRALDAKEYDQAVEVLSKVIRQEAAARDPDAQLSYGVAIRRALSADNLKRVAPYLLDDIYAGDVVEIMRRAGTTGTKVMIDLLIGAPTQAERRAYLRALRQVEEGSEVITSLLNHHEWFVVRNAADLVGELRIQEAAEPLGRVVQHDDPRVRRSVGMALARIGTPSAAGHLRKVFRDPDPDVRLAVVREVGGKGLSGLAMPLVSAAEEEEDEAVVCEYYRALGRIGTPDAVQALTKAALTGPRRLLGRKAGPAQLAAVEGLAAAGRGAREALEAIASRATGELKQAARTALAAAH